MAVPIYLQVYADLSSKINNDVYPVGSLLPTEPELEKIYGVSRTTVRKAMALLVSGKMVFTKQGYGSEVIAKKTMPKNHVRFYGVTDVSEDLTIDKDSLIVSPMCIDLIVGPKEVTEFLDLAPGTEIYRIQRVFSTKGKAGCTPVYYIQNYLSPETYPNLEQFDQSDISLYTLLANQYGQVLDNCNDVVNAVPASFLESQILNLPMGTPLFRHSRRAYTKTIPLEFAITSINPKYYEMRVHMQGALVEPVPITD